ncbi:MAG: hypothetical protein ACREMD_12020 [Gemmatimonadota bacterium]
MTRLRDLLRREIREHLEAVYRLDGEIRALDAERAEDAPETPPPDRSGASGAVNESGGPVVPWWEEDDDPRSRS